MAENELDYRAITGLPGLHVEGGWNRLPSRQDYYHAVFINKTVIATYLRERQIWKGIAESIHSGVSYWAKSRLLGLSVLGCKDGRLMVYDGVRRIIDREECEGYPRQDIRVLEMCYLVSMRLRCSYSAGMTCGYTLDICQLVFLDLQHNLVAVFIGPTHWAVA